MPLPAPLLNLIYTNVPGSPTALYCVGKRMLSSYPHVPTGYELGVGIAVQSYNGKMCFGLTADAVVAAGGALLVTADHGNCEMMRDPQTGGPHTAHTLNQVPAILAGRLVSGRPRSVARRRKPAAHRKPRPVVEPAPVEPPVAAQFPPALDHAKIA